MRTRDVAITSGEYSERDSNKTNKQTNRHLKVRGHVKQGITGSGHKIFRKVSIQQTPSRNPTVRDITESMDLPGPTA